MSAEPCRWATLRQPVVASPLTRKFQPRLSITAENAAAGWARLWGDFMRLSIGLCALTALVGLGLVLLLRATGLFQAW
jgi:hypothetical protein